MKTSNRLITLNKCWSKRFQTNWLVACHGWYWKHFCPTYINLNKEIAHRFVYRMDSLVWLYDYSCKKGYITVTFETFKYIILCKQISPNFVDTTLYPVTRKPHGKYFQLIKHPNYLQYNEKKPSTKYQKKKGVLQGVNDPESKERKAKKEGKELWRQISGKDRDRRKTYYRRGPGKYYKQLRTSKHRAWTKQQLHCEGFESFHRKEREVFVGWYDWA